MTDNEIIKALEICRNENGICSDCPYSDDYTNCNTRIAKDVLDLINRQKAEIDSLKSELDAAIKAITPCCLNCKHYKRNPFGDYGCLQKYEPSGTSRCANWKWIGVKEREVDNNAE